MSKLENLQRDVIKEYLLSLDRGEYVCPKRYLTNFVELPKEQREETLEIIKLIDNLIRGWYGSERSIDNTVLRWVLNHPLSTSIEIEEGVNRQTGIPMAEVSCSIVRLWEAKIIQLDANSKTLCLISEKTSVLL